MAAVDLCSTAEVREFLQKPDADQEQDPILGTLITRASLAVMRYTSREFAPKTDGATRTFEAGDNWWDAFLSLAPYDLRGNPTQVKIDTDLAAATILTVEEYRPFPRPPRDGVYYALRLRPQHFGTSAWFGDVREVQVTGNWGFPSVPEDVKHATVVTVADWFRRDVAAFSTTFNVDTGQFDVPQALPRAVLPILDSYKRLAP